MQNRGMKLCYNESEVCQELIFSPEIDQFQKKNVCFLPEILCLGFMKSLFDMFPLLFKIIPS